MEFCKSIHYGEIFVNFVVIEQPVNMHQIFLKKSHELLAYQVTKREGSTGEIQKFVFWRAPYWMATNNNVTGSYCLSKKVTPITSHHLYYSMCSKCLPPARTQVRRRCATIQQHIQSVTHSSPLAVDASFQFVDVRELGTIDLLLINVKEITDFQWFSGLTVPSMNSLL